MARISRATGLNVVMGSGHYHSRVHAANMDDKSVDEIAEEIIRDFTVSADEGGIRSGFIGEFGCSWPLDE